MSRTSKARKRAEQSTMREAQIRAYKLQSTLNDNIVKVFVHCPALDVLPLIPHQTRQRWLHPDPEMDEFVLNEETGKMQDTTLPLWPQVRLTPSPEDLDLYHTAEAGGVGPEMVAILLPIIAERCGLVWSTKDKAWTRPAVKVAGYDDWLATQSMPLGRQPNADRWPALTHLEGKGMIRRVNDGPRARKD